MLKSIRRAVAALCLVLGTGAQAQEPGAALWTLLDQVPAAEEAKPEWIRPQVFQAARLDMQGMIALLNTAPREFTQQGDNFPLIITLPMPDGAFHAYEIVESPIMEPGLAEQFPQIRTFRGQGISDPHATIRLDYTPQGFHAAVRSPEGGVYIDPYSKGDDSFYAVYATRLYTKAQDWTCGTEAQPMPLEDYNGPYAPRNANPLRTYRLACAATGEYTAFHGGTVTLGQAAVVTAVNRVTGVYETELGIRMTLVANNSSLIYTNSSTDPYTNNNGSTMLGQNQTNITNVIGSANYDIGHVFSTGGGGIAGLGVVCSSSNKARGVTGSGSPNGDPFWIDYVAHEMGHQFGGNHSYNGTSGSCGGNRNSSTSYEPGSGSTIMAYAGICGADNLQTFSDPYFSFISMQEITTFTTSGGGSSCDGNISTGNTAPTANAGPNYTIPHSTPFTLVGSGNDANNDPLTYCWEQRDTRSTGFTLATGDPGAGAIMRSWLPTTNPNRTIPRLQNLLNNTFATGEILPDAARTLNFRLTTRDNRAGAGGFGTDDVVITVASAGPFQVTAPNAAVNWTSGSSQTVTWNVSGTNASPVNTANVRILLSTDGGSTYPHVLLASTPNSGSANVTIPGVNTTQARIKVEAVNNIYFDVSNVNFTIAGCAAPAINDQPDSLAACLGEPATFTVSATGSGLSYQWRKGLNNIGGATGPAYTIPAVAAGDIGSYDCVITGTCGNVTSSAATLSIATAPAITTQPVSQTACTGASVTFSVVASGTPAPTYQWRKGATDISGATGPSLTISPVMLASAATYTCIVTNSCGSVPSDGAVLSVQSPPTIFSNPSPQTVCVGESFTFSVAAGGNPSPTFQWRKNGGNILGATSSSYTASAENGSGGTYDCLVSNTCNTITSGGALLSLNVPPTITAQPQPQIACAGGAATFTITFSGSPTPTVQWRHLGQNLSGETSPTLSLTNLTPSDAGAYDCVVTNACNSFASDPAVLTVGTPATITTQPTSTSVSENTQASFTVVAGGAGPFTYQWRYNGGNLSEGGSYTGTAAATLVINPAATALAGDYDCIVSNDCGGETSSIATLTVEQTGCGTADFDGDGDIGTDADIEAFFACLAGNCCATCFSGGADFNGDGDLGTDADIEAFFRVLAGGAC